MSDSLLSRGKKHLVVGLGSSGYSVIRYCREHQIPVCVTDTRAYPPFLSELIKTYPMVERYLGGVEAGLAHEVDVVVLSPGIAIDDPMLDPFKALGLPIVSDIECFATRQNAPLVAITGTNGKSTVTALVSHMAACAGWDVRTGGNYGVPALSLLTPKVPDLYVLELSSYQLETVYTLAPDVATILNITEDHMERYESFTHYAQAKHRIYQNAKTALYNRDCPLTRPNAADREHPMLTLNFGFSEPQAGEVGIRQVGGLDWLSVGSEALIPVNAIEFASDFQLQNIMAAIGLAREVQIPTQAILEGIRTFSGLPHRCQHVGQLDGIDFYNDSKATNPGACEAALRGLSKIIDNKLILIAGGDGKGVCFKSLAAPVKESCRHVFLYGEDALVLCDALRNSVPLTVVECLDQAVKIAFQEAEAGDAVLLSPACASFDQYSNYQQRGAHFELCVKALMGQGNPSIPT